MVQSTQTKESKYGKAVLGVDLFGDAKEDWLNTYDELDRVVGRRLRTDGDPMGANDKVMSYEYDPEGNVTKMTESVSVTASVTEGKVTRYEYYRDNLLHKMILERAGESDGVFTYSYDPAGRLDKIVYPASTDIEAVFRDEADLTVTGIGTGFDPNGNLRFLRYQKKSTGALIRRFEWRYDDSNNREFMLDVTPTQAVKWEYGVDWLASRRRSRLARYAVRRLRLVSVKRAEAVAVANLPASPLGAAYLQREYVFDETA